MIRYWHTAWRHTKIKVLFYEIYSIRIKAALSGLRQFLSTKSTLKMKENIFYFTWKTFFVLKIIKFLSWLFGHVENRLDEKDKVNSKFYDVITSNVKTMKLVS